METRILYENLANYRTHKKRDFEFCFDKEVFEANTVKTIHNLIVKVIGDDIDVVKKAVLILLDETYKITGVATLSTGTTKELLVDYKIIGKYITDTSARNIIIAFNCTDSKVHVSKKEIEITMDIMKLCDVLNVRLLDSFIVTREDFDSVLKKMKSWLGFNPLLRDVRM